MVGVFADRQAKRASKEAGVSGSEHDGKVMAHITEQGEAHACSGGIPCAHAQQGSEQVGKR
jgi:hypothetical protein